MFVDNFGQSDEIFHLRENWEYICLSNIVRFAAKKPYLSPVAYGNIAAFL